MIFDELKAHVETGARILGSEEEKLEPAGRYLIAVLRHARTEREFYELLRRSFNKFMDERIAQSYFEVLKVGAHEVGNGV